MPDILKKLISNTGITLFDPMSYRVKNQDDGNTAVIDIDGFIGRDWFREWVTGEKSPNTGEALKDQLRSITAKKIIVNINSPGGDFNEGLVIRSLLESKDAEVITNLYGLSASAATAVHQGGTKRRMVKNTSFQLIHRVMFGLLGYYNQNSLKSFIGDMEVFDKNLISMYAEASNVDATEIAELMDEGEGYGKWIDAERSLELGLIDEIFDPSDSDDPDTDHMEASEEETENNLKGQMKNVESLMLYSNIHKAMNGNGEEPDEDDKLKDNVSASKRMRELRELQLKQRGMTYA